MYQVIWSDVAEEAYEQTWNYILQNWSMDTVFKLEQQVQDLLTNLSLNHRMCSPLNEYPGLRKCVINKHNSLIYRIDDAEQAIRIMAFINNRMNHPFFN